MPYDEKFKDENFLNVLGGLWVDTQYVASKVGCSYEEAKYRLRILHTEDKIRQRREPSGGSQIFKWQWKLNESYIEPIMNPEHMGLHFFDRGLTFEKVRFMKFAVACQKILKVSGLRTHNEFTADQVLIVGQAESSNPLIVTRTIENTSKSIKSSKKGRYVEFAYTGKEKKVYGPFDENGKKFLVQILAKSPNDGYKDICLLDCIRNPIHAINRSIGALSSAMEVL